MHADRLKPIFAPQSIAVIGATNRPGSVGRAVMENLIHGNFTGGIYPVNKDSRFIHSIRTYPSILDIPDPVDLGIVIVPPPAVEEVVEQAAEKGVKGVIVITAGFKEIGGVGVEREERLKTKLANLHISLIGPNCLGIINTNPGISMNASFSRNMPRHGRIAVISQSGALCTAIMDYAAGHDIGFSKFVSFGNKADVDEIDLLDFLKDDPDTDVIVMYLEDITDGRRFLETAREINWQYRKPMLAMKSGRSPKGALAASSHTGALAGSDAAYDAIFHQSGIQRMNNLGEVFDAAIAFARQPLPKGNRIAIITNAGGPGIMTVDAADRFNLELAELKKDTKERLASFLPSTANLNNPVDIIGDADYKRYEGAIRTVLEDENVSGAIVIMAPQAITDILQTAEILPRATQGIEKPVLCVFMGIVDVSEGVRYLESHGFPNYFLGEQAVHAMASMVHFTTRMTIPDREVISYEVDTDRAREFIGKTLGKKDSVYLPQTEANTLLSYYGFPVLEGGKIAREEDIEPALDRIGFPVAMKIDSPDVVHKFDAGGVMLKIKSVGEAKDAFRRIIGNVKQRHPEARITGVRIEEMAKKGVEVILGANRDPKFGAMVMAGLGGTFVEVMKDVTFRLAPMWKRSAYRMLESLKMYPLLKGIRGMPPSDIEAIEECILRLSQLMTEQPEVAELDINPLIVYPEGRGCVVADSRIVLKRSVSTT
ncbi:MAG: acetate--CoA ligase family protein [Deltaproteobacteria bacterium]|nr:acetate--CoA ligase family protein [Deltaproteobacteria bacterium]